MTVVDLTDAEDLCMAPGALERVRRAFASLEPGEQLEVLSTVTEHAFAVRAWSRKHGAAVVSDDRENGVSRIILERGAAAAAG